MQNDNSPKYDFAFCLASLRSSFFRKPTYGIFFGGTLIVWLWIFGIILCGLLSYSADSRIYHSQMNYAGRYCGTKTESYDLSQMRKLFFPINPETGKLDLRAGLCVPECPSQMDVDFELMVNYPRASEDHDPSEKVLSIVATTIESPVYASYSSLDDFCIPIERSLALEMSKAFIRRTPLLAPLYSTRWSIGIISFLMLLSMLYLGPKLTLLMTLDSLRAYMKLSLGLLGAVGVVLISCSLLELLISTSFKVITMASLIVGACFLAFAFHRISSIPQPDEGTDTTMSERTTSESIDEEYKFYVNSVDSLSHARLLFGMTLIRTVFNTGAKFLTDPHFGLLILGGIAQGIFITGWIHIAVRLGAYERLKLRSPFFYLQGEGISIPQEVGLYREASPVGLAIIFFCIWISVLFIGSRCIREWVSGAVVASTWHCLLFGSPENGIQRLPLLSLRSGSVRNQRALDKLIRFEGPSILDSSDNPTNIYSFSPSPLQPSVGSAGYSLGVHENYLSPPPPYLDSSTLGIRLLAERSWSILSSAFMGVISSFFDAFPFIDDYAQSCAKNGPLALRWMLHGYVRHGFSVIWAVHIKMWTLALPSTDDYDQLADMDEDIYDEDDFKPLSIKAVTMIPPSITVNGSGGMVLPRQTTVIYIDEFNPYDNIISKFHAICDSGSSTASWSIRFFQNESWPADVASAVERMCKADFTFHTSAAAAQSDHLSRAHNVDVRSIESPSRLSPNQELLIRHNNGSESNFDRISGSKFCRLGAATSFSNAVMFIPVSVALFLITILVFIFSSDPTASICQSSALFVLITVILSEVSKMVMQVPAIVAETVLMARVVEASLVGSKKDEFQEGALLAISGRYFGGIPSNISSLLANIFIQIPPEMKMHLQAIILKANAFNNFDTTDNMVSMNVSKLR